MVKPTSDRGPVYAVDWFTEHIPYWERNLIGRFDPNARALLIGAYEGRCLIWLYENVLKGAKAHATVVDNWDYAPCTSERSIPVWNPGVRDTFVKNTAPYRHKLSIFDDLSLMRSNTKPFDIVYIDAKGSRHALEHAVLTFPMLVPGGVMIIQNYTHSKEHDQRCPRMGIDAFADCYAPWIRVLRPGFHFFLQKRVEPLTVAPCHSEYFDEHADPMRFPDCSKLVVGRTGPNKKTMKNREGGRKESEMGRGRGRGRG